MIWIFLITLLIFFYNKTYSDEIIKDVHGNYFLIKKDGTFKKLPPPKKGNKYIIKKRVIEKTKKKGLLKKPEKKARVRTNQGIR